MKKLTLALFLSLPISAIAAEIDWIDTFTIPDAQITSVYSDEVLIEQTGSNSFSIMEISCGPGCYDGTKKAFTITMNYKNTNCTLKLTSENEGEILKISHSTCPGLLIGRLRENYDYYDYTIDNLHNNHDNG